MNNNNLNNKEKNINNKNTLKNKNNNVKNNILNNNNITEEKSDNNNKIEEELNNNITKEKLDNNNKIEEELNNNIIEEKLNNDLLNIIEEKNQKIKELNNNIEILNKEIIDNKLYFRSEIDNINKKKINEIEKIRKFSNENIMLELITVIDNLERTIEYSNNTNNPLINGIKLTLKLFINIVNKFGLNSIEDINVKFNPDIHQAVVLEYNENIESDYVIEILQKGYILNGRLIRPAMTKISKDKNN